ncbi:MAG: recombinase family protein [Clostridia bacterium]|nr:recombinase family protein [Clostridia bacterium]
MDLFTIRRELMAGKSIYDLPLRVTHYSRVSTDKEQQKTSLVNQDTFYEQKILSIPNWTLVKGYTDNGITGTSTKKRNDFNEMIEDGLNDKFDLILTKEVCRFARNTLDTLQITRQLLSKGIGVLFELDNINTLETEGELRLTIMASLAQDESRRTSERTKFGFARSIEKGRVLGNDAIWGYKKDKCKLVIIEEEAYIVRRIYEIYSTGKIGIRKVGDELAKEGIFTKEGKKFAYSTVKSILTNSKYKGFYCGGKTQTIDFISKQRAYLDKSEWTEYKAEESVVPAIVDEKLWDKCNSILNRRSEKAKSDCKSGYDNKYKYSGKIFCKKDGNTYWRTLSRNKELWQCALYKKDGNKGCKDNVNLYTKSLDEILKNIFNQLFIDKKTFVNNLINNCVDILKDFSSEDDIKKKEGELEVLNKEKKKLINLFTKDLITEKEFEEANNEYNEKIEVIKTQYDDLVKLRDSRDNDKIQNKLRQSFEKNLEFYNGMPDEMVEAILNKVTVEKLTEDGLANLEIILNIGTTVDVLYKKGKIVNQTGDIKMAS